MAAKGDPMKTDHTPPGVHSVVQMPNVSAGSLGRDQDNAMEATGRFGVKDYFYPDSAEDALLFHVEHGAVPLHPGRWPWRGDTLVPLPPDPGLICPDPTTCFPYELHPDTSGVACIHTGGQTVAFADIQRSGE